MNLTQKLVTEALEAGFDLAGTAPVVSPATYADYRKWIEKGHHGTMDYLRKGLKARQHPEGVLPGVKGILMLGAYYGTRPPEKPPPGTGTVSRYAGFVDYHISLRKRLKRLTQRFLVEVPDGKARGVVDTAPLMERQLAVDAGLGQFGKNTMLLHPHYGSSLFLAAVLTSEPLEDCFRERVPSPGKHPGIASTKHDRWNPCENCRACQEACPTGALETPYLMNARRCLNYWTIEHQDAIPEEFRRRMDRRLFGCDTCQHVCPWNADLPPLVSEAFRPLPELQNLPLVDLFFLGEPMFRKRFGKTPLARLGRSGLLRNAAGVLTNHPERHALEALSRGLREKEAVVRLACVEALSSHRQAFPLEPAADLLRSHQMSETDSEVLQAIEKALD